MSKTFTLISLGSRGVGKTVFLAYNCAEILRSSQNQKDSETLWFECLDQEFQEKIEKLVGYVVRTGQYPPPTFKIEDFVFSLKKKSLSGDKTLCNFRWLDLPGEWCNIQNLEFQSILLQSHGGCVFIDIHALLNEKLYLETVETIMNQVEAIASLVNHNNLNYPMALICTKCDLVDFSPIGLVQIEARLLPILKRFEAVKAHYRRFYSPTPTTDQPQSNVLQLKDAKAPLLWLMTELQRLHGSDDQSNLGNSLNHIISNEINNPAIAIDSKDSDNFSISQLKSFLSWKKFRSQKIILIILLACGILSGILALSLKSDIFSPKVEVLTSKQKLQKYESVLQIDPSNREAIAQIVDAYLEIGQPDQAIVRLEKILQDSPNNINVLLEIAGLYALKGQDIEEENAYDQILNQEKNNVFALIGKAGIRKKKGDLKAAKILLDKAGKTAPVKNLKSTN
jgi:tetratricopeptide (TPR) repeat protein